MKKFTSLLVVIMTLLTFLAGTVSILKANAKVASTSLTLAIVHESISRYNIAPVKTPEMEKQYEEDCKIRKAIYESDDFIIRTFSNSHDLVKVCWVLWSFLSTIAVGYVWIRPLTRKKSCKKKRHGV